MATNPDLEKPMRQAAGVVGGFLLFFVVADVALASDGVRVPMLGVAGALLAFAFIR